jgi:hypothetical protein
VFGQVFVIQGPGSVSDDFIDIPAVADAVVSVVFVHHRLSFVGAGESVTADPDQLK